MEGYLQRVVSGLDPNCPTRHAGRAIRVDIPLNVEERNFHRALFLILAPLAADRIKKSGHKLAALLHLRGNVLGILGQVQVNRSRAVRTQNAISNPPYFFDFGLFGHCFCPWNRKFGANSSYIWTIVGLNGGKQSIMSIK